MMTAKNRNIADIIGHMFGHLAALYPTEVAKDNPASVMVRRDKDNRMKNMK